MDLPFCLPYIRWADTALFAAGHSVMPDRRLYDHELVYVLEGHGQIVLEGQAHRAVPDRLFLVQPRIHHSFKTNPGGNMLLLGVHFDWIPQSDTVAFATFSPAAEPVLEARFRAPREIPGWELATAPFLDLQGRLRVRRLLEEVVAEHARHDSEAPTAASALLAAAIAAIAREARLLRELKSNLAIGADAVRRVQRARELLEKPHPCPLSIDEVAQQVGWSADHLRRMFRAVLGNSPASIRTAARIRRAQELLRYESLPVAEIAARCGFDDPSHFVRVFKKTSGLSPRQFQSLARKL